MFEEIPLLGRIILTLSTIISSLISLGFFVLPAVVFARRMKKKRRIIKALEDEEI